MAVTVSSLSQKALSHKSEGNFIDFILFNILWPMELDLDSRFLSHVTFRLFVRIMCVSLCTMLENCIL